MPTQMQMPTPTTDAIAAPPPGWDAAAPARPAAPFPRLYLTADLRAATGLPRTHMDFYLREGIVRPTAKTESGFLLFDQTELDTLRAVLRWRADGVGIREIRARLGRPAGDDSSGALGAAGNS
jgi:hypothetical protein